MILHKCYETVKRAEKISFPTPGQADGFNGLSKNPAGAGPFDGRSGVYFSGFPEPPGHRAGSMEISVSCPVRLISTLHASLFTLRSS